MKAQTGSKDTLLSLPSALVGGRWSTPRPARFSPGTHREIGWVDSRAGLDGYGKSHRHRGSKPGPSSP